MGLVQETPVARGQGCRSGGSTEGRRTQRRLYSGQVRTGRRVHTGGFCTCTVRVPRLLPHLARKGSEPIYMSTCRACVGGSQCQLTRGTGRGPSGHLRTTARNYAGLQEAGHRQKWAALRKMLRAVGSRSPCCGTPRGTVMARASCQVDGGEGTDAAPCSCFPVKITPEAPHTWPLLPPALLPLAVNYRRTLGSGHSLSA